MPPARRPGASARSVAAKALMRVLRDGAFAAAALSAELDRATAAWQSATARWRPSCCTARCGITSALEARLAPLAPRGLKDVVVKAELLVAAYQLLVARSRAGVCGGERGRQRRARARGKQVAGFANAVLRKVGTGREAVAERRRCSRASPPWLFERAGSVGR